MIDPFAIGVYDGTVEALRYFETPPVSQDTNDGPGGYGWGTYGKTGIRLHHGHADDGDNSSGSAGCMVSFTYYSLRDLMLDKYQETYRLINGGVNDPNLQPLDNLNHDAAMAAKDANTITSAAWDTKLRSFLYPIRPDEQPHT